LKPEQWGSPLVQEKYQEEKACDKRHPYRIIIIIIMRKDITCTINCNHTIAATLYATETQFVVGIDL